MANERQYVPKANCRARNTQFGEVLSLGFSVKELIEFAEQHRNEKGYINLVIAPRREPTEYATHSVYLDDYKPGQRRQQQSQPTRPASPPPQAAPEAPSDSDDVPF